MSGGRIGIFDSGLGGLSIAREIRARLAAESILYVADTAYCPYGDRLDEEIRARSIAICEYLAANGAKVIVVACNTASGAALEVLRERISVPIIGTEPAVKPAVELSSNGRVGVLATSSTVRSDRFRRLIDRYAGDSSVVPQACPGLADMVEQGIMRGPLVEERLSELLRPLKEAGVDTVVLGCTHYPFLASEVQRIMGPDVRLVESGVAIARRTEGVLAERGLLVTEGEGEFRLQTTGDPAPVAEVVARLWGSRVEVEAIQVQHHAAGGQARSVGGPPSEGNSR